MEGRCAQSLWSRVVATSAPDNAERSTPVHSESMTKRNESPTSRNESLKRQISLKRTCSGKGQGGATKPVGIFGRQLSIKSSTKSGIVPESGILRRDIITGSKRNDDDQPSPLPAFAGLSRQDTAKSKEVQFTSSRKTPPDRKSRKSVKAQNELEMEQVAEKERERHQQMMLAQGDARNAAVQKLRERTNELQKMMAVMRAEQERKERVLRSQLAISSTVSSQGRARNASDPPSSRPAPVQVPSRQPEGQPQPTQDPSSSDRAGPSSAC
eukprot:1249268-Pleurochrysis_carterae.AAC.1